MEFVVGGCMESMVGGCMELWLRRLHGVMVGEAAWSSRLVAAWSSWLVATWSYDWLLHGVQSLLGRISRSTLEEWAKC